jgi:hypothetical protein
MEGWIDYAYYICIITRLIAWFAGVPDWGLLQRPGDGRGLSRGEIVPLKMTAGSPRGRGTLGNLAIGRLVAPSDPGQTKRVYRAYVGHEWAFSVATYQQTFEIIGAPKGTRTPVFAVRGLSDNSLTVWYCLCKSMFCLEILLHQSAIVLHRPLKSIPINWTETGQGNSWHVKSAIPY